MSQLQRPWILFLLVGVFVFSLHRLSLDSTRAEAPLFHEQVDDLRLDAESLANRSEYNDGKNTTRLSPTSTNMTQASSADASIPTTSNNNSTTWQQQPFPRWSGGIAVQSLVEGIRVSLEGRLLKPDRIQKVYMIDDEARLWKAAPPRPDVTAGETTPLTSRGESMETLAVSVLQIIWNDTKEEKYPHLKAVIRQGGFAYIANHADSKFCCDAPPFVDARGKPVINVTVPIFTLSAPVGCQYSFPIPTFATIQQAEKSWPRLVARYRVLFPWSQKQRRAVWRGAPTGNSHAKNNTRVQLCQLAAKRPDLVDAKLTRTRKVALHDFKETPYLGARIPMTEFQNYRAILDTDGHSWSSRFGELLCYSSVVLKVQPAHVDYFHTELRPWVHYIPVEADLSDLFEKVEFAVSDEPRVRQIIDYANMWCLRRLNTYTLVQDMARIWDTYASHLFQADPSWGVTWRTERQTLLDQFNFTFVG
jgi:Glycosyl transferase family 90